LDSSFIISFALENDENRKKAKILIEQEEIWEQECYISNNIINEVITVIGNNSDANLAKETYYILQDNFTILDEQKIENFNDKVMDIYEEYDTKLSFTDSSILLLMEYYDIPTLVSFYKGFKKNKEINLINLDSINE
ncbi:MAG: hypothetical protein BZ138_06855, partial [Methanosphaera sp. rholeuAM270]